MVIAELQPLSLLSFSRCIAEFQPPMVIAELQPMSLLSFSLCIAEFQVKEI
jgi:hypothetical protein